MLKKIDTSKANEYQNALITTSKGDIKLKLFADEAPQAVCNFANLAQEGFYKGLKFHRVIPNFVIQGGCPYGNGMGGPGYEIECECDNQRHKHLRGTLSMAHAGRDTGGSQFFITHSPQPHLDGVHTVFGQIDLNDEASLKVLDSIKQGDIIEDIKIFKDEKAKSPTTKAKNTQTSKAQDDKTTTQIKKALKSKQNLDKISTQKAEKIPAQTQRTKLKSKAKKR